MQKILSKLPEKLIFLPFLALPLLTGFLSSKLMGNSMSHYSELTLPALAPPSFVFPVVWTILFLMMGLASYFIFKEGNGELSASKALKLYVVQLLVNFFWPILFFRMEAYLLAFVWLVLLWFLVVMCITAFSEISKKSAFLLVPYLLWITFAAYLNMAIFLLNR